MPPSRTSLPPLDLHARFVQQAVWTKHLRDYLYSRAGPDTAHRVLEVGCGTGALLSEWEQIETSASIYGLDISREILSVAMRNAPAAAYACGDGLRLPFADSAFDIVFCHFLLLWVASPQGVVGEMARLLRPGGALLALAEPDYGGRIDYPIELQRLGEWQAAALQSQGANIAIGRQLSALFHRSGLAEIETGVIGGQWRASLSQADFDLEWNVLTHDLKDNPQFVKNSARCYELEIAARRAGSRVLFVPTFYAVGYRPTSTGIPI